MKEGSPISESSIDLEQEQQRRRQRSLKQACLVARIADEYKGRDILVLDLTAITPIVDFFVLATGTSRRQMHAVVEEVDRVLTSLGSRRLGVEGYDSSTWILQDYGDVVLHVFTPEARKLYDLEHLWADAPRVDWQAYLDEDAAEVDSP
ncbi:MAG: ribosome silencing factor [Planctomycetes bacterium]|nr:ribosome silencing factor [Planctomycetota bacterium]